MEEPEKTKFRPYFPSKKARAPMVSWFSPSILLKTLRELLLSKIVGSQLDTREIQSINENIDGEFESEVTCKITHPYQANNNQDFYFDFIADTGDGWDSTYTIASLLSRDKLVLEIDGEKQALKRGEFLIMGGDEVYPGPSEAAYQQKLLSPYEQAWDWLWLNQSSKEQSKRQTGQFISLDKPPEVYAIPGNHDWYDSLIAFRKVFCNIFKSHSIGRWKTNQTRSYFALGLPQNWVVLAFDFGLDQYKLDGLQEHYFREIIRSLTSDSRIIIVAAEPNWNYGGVQNKPLNQAYKDVEELIEEVFLEKKEPAAKIYLNLSGDTHNYQRYEILQGETLANCIEKCAKKYELSEQQISTQTNINLKRHHRQQIVSGGGGAFLHPTHALDDKNMEVIPGQDYRMGDYLKTPHKTEVEIKDMFELKECYPKMETSKKLSNQIFFKFLPNNTSLGMFIATVYLVLAWPMRAFLDSMIIQQQFNGFADSGLNFLTLLISMGLITGFTLWARSRPGFGLTLAGITHGFFQVSILYGGYVLVYFMMSYLWKSYDWEYGWFLFPIARDLVFFIFVSILSPLALSIALYIYLNYFNADQNDLFGSGSVADHKHLLRFKIEHNGQLTIYPIAIEKVASYSMPSDDEVDSDKLSRLIKCNGEQWNKQPCYSPLKNEEISPVALSYQLIEAPIVISP